MDPEEQLAFREELRQIALAQGFHVARFAKVAPPPGHEHLLPWLASGHHADMSFLAKDPRQRCDPGLLAPKPQGLLILGVSYHSDQPHNPTIARYAQGGDYHIILKERANRIKAWITSRLGYPVPGRPLVDSAPLLEKPLASSCGVGWQGKNTLLVSRRFGCHLLLAELPLPFALPPDPPEKNHCGDCTLCLQACPTNAFPAPYQLDARLCIAYLTIEHRDPIPLELRPLMGERLFGCDACLSVCPFNRFDPAHTWEEFQPRHLSHTLPQLAFLSPEAFRDLFHGTALWRTGEERLLRNLAVALGNGRNPENLPALHHLLHHPSPLVQEHAAWGIARFHAENGSSPLAKPMGFGS